MPFVKYRLQYASCVSADKITLNHGGKCRDDNQSKEYDYDVEKTEGDDDDAEEERNAKFLLFAPSERYIMSPEFSRADPRGRPVRPKVQLDHNTGVPARRACVREQVPHGAIGVQGQHDHCGRRLEGGTVPRRRGQGLGKSCC